MANSAALELILELQDGASKGLQNVQKELEGTSAKADILQTALGVVGGGLISKGIDAVTGAFGDLKSGMIDGNAEFERYQVQFGVLLGSTDKAKQRLADLADFGAKTPFELPEVVQADKILQGFGLHSEESAKKFGFSGKEILTIAGDLAAGTGADFTEISNDIGKLGSGATGEAISRFQELGIVTREELTKMGLQFSKSGELTSPLPQAMNTVLTAMKQKFGGMMDAQSSTFEGMLSNLDDWKGQTLRTIGAPIFDVLKTQLNGLLAFLGSDAVHGAVDGFAHSLADGIGGAMTWLTTTAIPALVSGWQSIQPAISTVGDVLSTLGGYFSTVVENGNVLNGWLYALPESVQPFLIAAGDLVNILGDIADTASNVGAALMSGDLAGAWDALTQGLSGIASDYQTYLDDLLTAIGGAVPQIVAQLGTWGQAFLDWIAPYIPPILDALGALAQSVLDWAIQQAPVIVAQLAAWGQAFIDWVGPQIPGILAGLGSLGASLLGWIGEQAGPILAQLSTWAQQFGAWIGPAVQGLLAQWPTILSTLLDRVGAAVGPLLAQLGQWAIQFVAWIAPMIPGFLAALGKVALALGAFVLETAGVLIVKLLQWGLAFVNWVAQNVLPKLPGALATIASALWTFITSAATEIASKLIQWGIAFIGWVAKEVIPKLPGALATIISTITGWVGGAVGTVASEAARIGSSLISGVTGAISGKAQSIASAAAKAVTDAIDAAKHAVGISSPSTMAAEEIGVPFVEGIVVGIEHATPTLETSTASLHDSLMAFFNDFGDAGTVFGDAFNALPPKVQAVIQQINAAGADGIGTLQNYFNGFDDAIQHLPPEMQDTVARLRAEFEGLPTDADASLTSLKTTFDRFLSDFGDWGQVFGPAFAALPAQIQGVIGQINDTLGSQGIGILQNYFNGFDDALAQLPAGVQDTVAQLRDQFTSLGDATAATSADVQTAVDDMAAGVESSTSALHDSVFAFFDDFGDAGTILGDAFEKLPPQLQGVIEEISNTLSDQGIGALENYLNGFDDYLSQLPEDVQGFVKQLRADLSTIPDDVQQSTQAITDALKEQQQSTEDLGPEIGQLGGVVDETGTTVQDTVQAIQDGVPNAEDAGHDLAMGVKSGMSSVHDELVDYAHHLVQDMIDEMRSTAQAASPSQATADNVGAPMAQGIAAGMESESGNLNESASTLVSDSVDAMAGSVSTLDDVGIPMMQGTIDGLIGMLPDLEKAIGKISKDSQDAFKQWLDDVHKLIDESFQSIIDQANDLFSAVGNAAKMFDSQRYADDVAAGYDKIAQLQDELTQNTADQQAAQEALTAATQQYNQDQQDLIALQDQQKQNAKELADAQQKQTDLENQKAVLQAQIDSGQIDEATGKAQMKALDKQIAAQNDVVNAAQKAYNDTQKQIADTQKDITDQQQIQKDSQKDINTLLDEQRKKQEEYNTQLEKNNDLLYQQTALRQVQESEMSQIQAAQEEAAKIADPTEAAKYLQIQLDFYEKYYDLQAQMIKAGDNTQQIEYLKQQQALLVQAHDAALEQLHYEQETTKSTTEDVAAGTTATSKDAATRKTLDELNNTIGNLNNILAKGIEVTVTQGHASGTEYAPGGWSWVGEKGPELMYVPQGSQIYAHGDSPGGGGASYSITVDARGASDPQAIEAAGYRGAKRALEEVGATAQIRKRAR